MRLVIAGIFVTGLAGLAQAATAQGNWQPQASPSPQPPVYTAVPPPPAPPRSGKEQPTRPKGNPGTWVTDDDYPAESLRNDEQGTTGFRLTIGPDGLVTACDITLSSGSALLDETACRLMSERGRFLPALDKKGKPTTGTWASRFRWVLPEPEPMKIEAFSQLKSFIVETDGTATQCQSLANGVSDLELDKGMPCNRTAMVVPFTDADGKPVRRKVTLTVSLTVTDPAAPPPPVAVTPPPPAPKPKRRKP